MFIILFLSLFINNDHYYDGYKNKHKYAKVDLEKLGG